MPGWIQYMECRIGASLSCLAIGFTKEITFERSRWHGWIKDYDGGTLMECIINPKISYTNFPDLIRTQVGPEGRSSIASSSPRSATLTSQTLYVPRWDEAVPQS